MDDREATFQEPDHPMLPKKGPYEDIEMSFHSDMFRLSLNQEHAEYEALMDKLLNDGDDAHMVLKNQTRTWTREDDLLVQVEYLEMDLPDDDSVDDADELNYA